MFALLTAYPKLASEGSPLYIGQTMNGKSRVPYVAGSILLSLFLQAKDYMW